MKKTMSRGLIAIAVFFAFACNQGGSGTDSVETAQDSTEQTMEAMGQDTAGLVNDAEHLINLASSDMFEIEAGKLAAERANNAQVQEFGQMMVDDHTKASEQMKSLAQSKNITLPTAMGNDHQEELNDLREEQGAEFDQEYMDVMVSSHDDAVDRMEDLQESEDPQIRSLAQTMLPTLRQHHEQAQQLEDQVNTTVTRADRDARRMEERESRGGWRYRVNDGATDVEQGVNEAATDVRQGVNETP